MRYIVASALLALLTACGGGGSDAPTAAPQQACIPQAQVRVQLFGDSTQEGWDGGTRQAAVYTPAVALQLALDARYGRGKTLVTSRARSGTTAFELVNGTDGTNQPWPRSVDADIVVVNHGINDATHYGGSMLPQYRAALEQLAKAPAVVVFETPNIVKGWDLAPYAQTMRDVAAAHRLAVADTYKFTSELPDWQILIPDWAHPSSELYKRIAEQVLYPTITPIVDKMLCI